MPSRCNARRGFDLARDPEATTEPAVAAKLVGEGLGPSVGRFQMFFRASWLLVYQWPIASCHVRRKGAGARCVLLALPLLAVVRTAWFPLDISSLTAQANANRS